MRRRGGPGASTAGLDDEPGVGARVVRDARIAAEEEAVALVARHESVGHPQPFQVAAEVQQRLVGHRKLGRVPLDGACALPSRDVNHREHRRVGTSCRRSGPPPPAPGRSARPVLRVDATEHRPDARTLTERLRPGLRHAQRVDQRGDRRIDVVDDHAHGRHEVVHLGPPGLLSWPEAPAPRFTGLRPCALRPRPVVTPGPPTARRVRPARRRCPRSRVVKSTHG